MVLRVIKGEPVCRAFKVWSGPLARLVCKVLLVLLATGVLWVRLVQMGLMASMAKAFARKILT
jgi:hypothetical protein